MSHGGTVWGSEDIKGLGGGVNRVVRVWAAAPPPQPSPTREEGGALGLAVGLGLAAGGFHTLRTSRGIFGDR